jgi:hypothetical protein
MTVYWASIEYKYDKVDKLKGGFVYAFVKASNSKTALDNIFQKLKEENMTSVKVEFIKEYDPMTEWDNSIQTKHYNELYSSALNSLDVILDDFYAYERLK